MSGEFWLERIRHYEQVVFLLRQEKASLEAFNDYVMGRSDIRTRRIYSKSATREHGTCGRVFLKCRACKKKRVIHGRGLCRKCYSQWHYANFTRKKLLGGKELTHEEYKKIIRKDGERARENKQKFEDKLAVDGLRRKGVLG